MKRPDGEHRDNMEETATCPDCGTPIPEAAPGGLCPKCMLGAGLDTAAPEETLDSGGAPPPHEGGTVASVGDTIGRYKLLQQIGEGGFGVVYMAEQTEPLKRQVALKVIKPGMDSKEIIGRFEAERQALALMDHPNIAQVYDAGTTKGGRPFFVMELVKGLPITDYCDLKELDTKARLELFTKVCSAVQHAHKKGVIHRDLKPTNILVSPHDGEPVVKVIDFGIAKAVGMELTEKTVFTQLGRMIGSPQYMSPEQAELNALDVDTRSDIYSLGVVLYELLTGTTPLDGERLRSAAYAEMQRLIREETPAKPSTRISALREARSETPSVRITDRGLSRDLDWITMKALEKERARRYETAGAFAEDIGRHLRDEPVLAGPPSIAYRMSKFARRHRRGLLNTAAAAIFACGAFLLWPKGEAEEGGPLVNSLGMQFVPVPGVDGMVSSWETRVRDYKAFAEETGRPWSDAPFEQSDDHPVVQVSWYDARAFCQWLTEREREAGLLGEGEVYRLPTDREWSAMAGLTNEEGVNPQERHLGQKTRYPYGEQAPVPEGGGNYPDELARQEYGSAKVAKYEDGSAATAPVGSYSPTRDGLYDLGGNVWEWTDTPFSEDTGKPALRGASWWAAKADDRWFSLLASYRRADLEASNSGEWDVGFRVVRGPQPEAEPNFSRLVQDGNIGAVGEMIASGTAVNAPNLAGQPPVVLAAESGSLELVKLLHQHGARLEASDSRGRMPLHAAAELGHAEIVGWLLEQDVNPRPRTIAGAEPLLLAMRHGNTALFDKLLEAGGSEILTRTDSAGSEPFATACLHAPDETVRWLIDNMSADQICGGSRLEVTNRTGLLTQRDSSLMKAFLEKAARHLDPGVLDLAAMNAVQYDNEASFNLILEALGTDELRSTLVRAAGPMAVSTGRAWAIKTLLSRGAGLEDFGKPDTLLFGAVLSKGSKLGRLGEFVEKLPSEKREHWRTMFNQQLAKVPPPATRQTIEILVQAGADIEARDDDEGTPLIAAAMNGNLDAVETLLTLEAEIEAKDDLGFTPVLCAVEEGDLEMVKLMVRHGADLTATNSWGHGALHSVTRHAELLAYLLAQDLPVNLKGEKGATPLHRAATLGYEDVVTLLLEAGADVHATADMEPTARRTPLHLACVLMDEEAKKAADQTKKEGVALGGRRLEDPKLADREERLRTIERLLAAGADPMAKDADWMTPLHSAARWDFHEAVELFLKNGAAPNAPTAVLNSPLHLACMGNSLGSAKALLEHGAVVDSPVFQISLLSVVGHEDNAELAALLVEHGAPLEKRDPYGAFPLHIAAFKGKPAVAEVLLKAGADPDVRDFSWRTPAHAAAGGNHREVIDALWKHGAKLNAVDAGGLTPAQLAFSSGHSALATHIEALLDRSKFRPTSTESKPGEVE